MNEEDLKRFWAKVRKTDTCWLWTGTPDHAGYGVIGVRGRRPKAHRLSWELHFGAIPDGRAVVQTCGEKMCVRPEHVALSAGLRVRSENVTPRARFFAYVVEGQTVAHVEGLGNCWNWTGLSDKDGYGRINVAGKLIFAHRFAWALCNDSDIPDGLHVLHRCDNSTCIRPDHLFLGTNAENMADRDSKCRQARGETNGSSKLKETDVISIRALYANGVSQREIAERFGISEDSVSNIVNRKNWRHVDAQDSARTPDELAAALQTSGDL